MPKGTRTATIVRKPRVDKLSTSTGSAAVETPMTGLIILPRQTYEQDRGWVTVEGWDVYILLTSRVVVGGTPRAFADGDIIASDQLRIDGVTWQVDGPPAPYDKGSKRKATVVKVKRVGS